MVLLKNSEMSWITFTIQGSAFSGRPSDGDVS